MTICDASVVLKWVRVEGEGERAEARAILEAHAAGQVVARLSELTYYEAGNVLARRDRWRGPAIIGFLADLYRACGEPLRLGLAQHADAAHLAVEYGLSFYDASYWAVARALGADLVTADSKLLAAGAGESPSAYCARVGIEVTEG